MRLERLILIGFGRFTSQRIDLQPGLNLLYGENESGKSTLQKFILGMLYGFKKRSLRREYTEDLHRFQPWSGAEYRGAIHYTLDATGHTYRVERLFEPGRESVKVFDGVTGADLSPSFTMDRRKELLFAEEHLRLSAEVFTSTAWVGQMEVGRLEIGRELVQRVANMSESGREDLSVRAALRTISDRMREIGSERAPTRPFARVTRLIAEKRQEQERAFRTREQTLQWELGLREARSAMAELEQQIEELQGYLQWAHLAEAEEQQARLQSSTAQMEAASQRARELSTYAFFPLEQRTRLLELQAEVRQATEALGRQRTRMAALMATAQALREQAERYGPLAELGPDGAAEVAAGARMAEAASVRLPSLAEEVARLDEMIARLDEALAPLAVAAESGEEALGQIDLIEQEVASIRQRANQAGIDRLRADGLRLERERQSVGGRGWLWASLLLVAAAAALWSVPAVKGLVPTEVYLPVVGGVGALGLLALLPFLVGRRAQAQIRGDLARVRKDLRAAEAAIGQGSERIRSLEKQRDQILRRLGVVSVGEVQNQFVRYEQLTARRDGQLMRREALQAEIRRAEEEVTLHRQQLTLALSLAEKEPGGGSGPESNLVGRLQEVMAQFQGLRLESEATERELREVERALAAEEQRIAVAQAASDAILAEAGVADLAAFEEACVQHEEWRKAEREAEGLRTAMRSLLGGEEADRVGQEVVRLRSLVQGERPEQLASSQALQAKIRTSEAERAQWHARASDLAARVETSVAETADTAELEREITALEQERAQMEAELAALELAESVIHEVSSQIHREFAPRLNRAMGQIIAQLTDGKYRTVRIDEDLMIRAIAEDDRTVEIASLSGGTIDQFYLALRVAILDLLTEGEERIPLLLDDPFVQYDNRRLGAAMDYLAQVAKDRQVVLMTCHRRELELGREVGAHIIELS